MKRVTVEEADLYCTIGRTVGSYYVWWRPGGEEYCLVWDASHGPIYPNGKFAVQSADVFDWKDRLSPDLLYILDGLGKPA